VMLNRLALSISLASVISIGVGAFSADALAAQQLGDEMEAVRASKRIAAVRISEPVRIDGVLNEAVWDLAPPAIDFYQQFPHESEASVRRTEVRFLYDDTALYVGAMLYDDTERLIVNDLKWDFGGFETDSIGLILDSYLDRRNSYGFLVNPGGAMRDALNTDRGRVHDSNWNGVWTARTAVLSDGWSVEFAIPFKTLRFPDRQIQEWGLNIVRNSRHINERSTWAPVPRQFTHYDVAYAGTLTGISGVRPGRNVHVKPFATGRIGAATPGASRWDADGGLDLKWGITSSLVLDATWRTDFSQVEADAQQINLTRFSLFFPEKRQFFLESPANFQIGLQERMGGRRDFMPFFTRRIGLVGGQPVPVIGGLRLTGRSGRQHIGVMNMQTDAFGGAPGDNFTAVVLRRSLTNTTSLGGFYFGRESQGLDPFNRVGGFDFRYSPRRTLEVEAFAMRSGSATEPGDWAGRTGFMLDGSRHRARVSWLHVGDTFRHDLGFVRRRDAGMLVGSYSLVLRPSGTSGRVREYTAGFDGEVTGDARYRQLLTGIGGISYGMLFADGGQFNASVNSTFERLNRPFRIGTTVAIAAGEYSFADAEVSYSSNRSAALSGSLRLAGGEFWTGRQRALSGSVRYRLSEHLAASASLGRSVITLADGSFTGDLLGLSVETSFNPRMFLNAFIQYNGETDTWLSNVRYNLIHRPLSDAYVVWNETRTGGVARRALLLKYTHLLAF